MSIKRSLKLAIVLGSYVCGVAYAADDQLPQASTHVANKELAWQPIVREDIPPGMELKRIHTNPNNQGGVAKLRFPAGYIEPKHYHTTAGHSIYVLSGRVDYMGVIATAGDFIYTPTNVVHGAIALEESEILIWSDGVMDFKLSDNEQEQRQGEGKQEK